jgi:beta-glucosidase-like glycosyl hydrolase
MNLDKLPPFAQMIIKRQSERNRSRDESSFISTLKTQHNQPNHDSFSRISQHDSRNDIFDDTHVSKCQISDISFSILDDDAQQIVDLQYQVQDLQRQNKELRNQIKNLQRELINCQDTSEIDSLSEELLEVKAQLEEERAQRKISEDHIVYLKREIDLKSKNVKANIKIIESLQIKNMKLQELISSMRGEPIDQSNYSQMMDSEQNSQVSFRSNSSGSSRASSARRSRRESLQPKRPDEMTDSELDEEIKRATVQCYRISNALDNLGVSRNDDHRIQLEDEFSAISRKLSQLEFERKMRSQE